MRTLLDKTDQRILLILEKLIHEDAWITVKKLADYVESSIGTVTYDLSFIKTNWNHILNIETSVTYGVRVKNKSTASIGLVAKDIFKASLPLNLLSDLFYHPWQSKDDICENLNISPSLFIQYIRRIRETLSSLYIHVNCQKGKYYLTSDNELRLRMFFANFFAEKSTFHDSAKKELLIDMMKDLNYKPMLDASNLDSEFIYLHTLLETSLSRENQNFLFQCKQKEVTIKPRLLNRINKFYPRITIDNIKNISVLFNEKLYVWDSKEEEDKITQLIKIQVMNFLDKMSIHKKEDMFNGISQIIINLYLACKVYDFKPATLFNRDRYFAINYKKYNTQVYGLLEDMFISISEKTGVDLSNLHESIVYWICIYNPDFHYYQFQKKILIVSDLGFTHCEMIKSHLEKRFNTDEAFIEVNCTNYGYVDAIDENKYDLIITTLPLVKKLKTKCIIINDDIDYEVLYHIEKVLYENN